MIANTYVYQWTRTSIPKAIHNCRLSALNIKISCLKRDPKIGMGNFPFFYVVDYVSGREHIQNIIAR